MLSVCILEEMLIHSTVPSPSSQRAARSENASESAANSASESVSPRRRGSTPAPMDLDLNSRISGDIYETYCTGCDKKIKIYVISNIKEPYNQDSAIEKIQKLAKDKRIDNKTLKPFIKDTDLKDDFYIVDLYGNFYSNRDYHCPNCNSIVSRYILSRNKCPKCNGEIKAVDGICLDKF